MFCQSPKDGGALVCFYCHAFLTVSYPLIFQHLVFVFSPLDWDGELSRIKLSFWNLLVCLFVCVLFTWDYLVRNSPRVFLSDQTSHVVREHQYQSGFIALFSWAFEDCFVPVIYFFFQLKLRGGFEISTFPLQSQETPCHSEEGSNRSSHTVDCDHTNPPQEETTWIMMRVTVSVCRHSCVFVVGSVLML